MVCVWWFFLLRLVANTASISHVAWARARAADVFSRDCAVLKCPRVPVTLMCKHGSVSVGDARVSSMCLVVLPVVFGACLFASATDACRL